MVKKALETRLWLKERDGTEWRVARLTPKHHDQWDGISTDARMLVVPPKGKIFKPKLTRSSNKCGRGDLRLWCPPLGGYHYWHRIVAYTWPAEDNSYEVLGGSKKKLPSSWSRFVQSELVVDHGPGGWSKILVDELRICTQERNQELQNEREASKDQWRKRKKTASPTKKPKQ